MNEQRTEGWIGGGGQMLAEKAVVYNNRSFVRLLLELDRGHQNNAFSFGINTTESNDHFQGAIHLAAFLGCVDIVQELLDHDSTICLLRGPVHMRNVAGPPSDLFRIIGYTEFVRNPRLTFQMKWLNSHPNERPVHYAICGGYPIIMKMLMEHDAECNMDGSKGSNYKMDVVHMHTEKDALLASLIRQAALCASYSCLAALLRETPDAMYMRDQRGWLYISSGLPHGMQFLRFLMENGFAVKLLNNIDGRGTVNALHIFYNSLSKSDGAVSKYTDLYDVTEFLVDLGVDINMETTAFKSHDVSDTPVHILIDHLNLVVSSLTDDDNFPSDSSLVENVQQAYDVSIRDAIYVLLEYGFDLEKHCNSLLKRLFMNRNFLKRFLKSKQEQKLVQGNYGLRDMYNIAKLLLGSGGIMLSPARREMTPSLCLIDTLRDPVAFECVLGDRRATQMFNSCLKLLFQKGDSPNIYPFSSKEDSYIATSMVQLCDIFVDQLCMAKETTHIKTAVVTFLDIIRVLHEAGANFTCFMNIRGGYMKHGVFDNFRKLFHTIHRQLTGSEESLNKMRLRIVHDVLSDLVLRGAAPVLHEYVFQKSHLPMTNSQVERTILGQVLLLGLHCSIDQQLNPFGPQLILTEEYKTLMEHMLSHANHQTYYACLNHVVALANENEIFEIQDESSLFRQRMKQLTQHIRKLTTLACIAIREHLHPSIKAGSRGLPLPSKLIDMVVN